VARLPKLSVRLHGGMTPQRCVAQAQAAEAAGFDGVWFAENPFARATTAAAAACAVATQRIRIGAGVYNPYSRHPSLIAMEIGALDELSGGRARLGVGSGIGSAIERMGLSYARPLSTLREAIELIRALLRGEEITHAGAAFKVERLKLDYRARADIEIFMAGRGDKSVETCGEIADGLIVSNMCSREFVARAAAKLNEAARAAGRAAPPGVVQYLPCIPRPDRDEARRLGRRAVGEMVPVYWALGQRLPDARRALLDGSGISEFEFAAAAQRLRTGEPADAAIDQRYVAAFAIAGTAEDCAAQAAAHAKAGVTELALTFTGDTFAADMAYLANAPSGGNTKGG
jgi:5,10-methylenetetrahydromethanopterin reductase